MKISHRLHLLIALPLLFLVAVGGYALNRLDLVGTRGQYVIDNTLPSYETLYAIALDARRIDALAVKRISVSKPEAAATLESALNDARKRLGENLEHYRKDLVSDEEDRAKIAKVADSMGKFLGRTDAVLAAARAGKVEEAHAAYDAGREDAETLNKQVEADIAFNRKVGDEFTSESKRIFKLSVGSLIASIAACAIAIIALGWLTLRAVMRPMQAMRDTAAAVSGKLDLTLRTPVVRRDEIGVTAEAFNALLARLQESLTGLKKNSDAVFEATTGVSTAAGQVSTSSTYQSDAAANMAASVEEMTVSISQIAQKAGETSELAATAGRAASEGEGVIRATTEEMNGVSKAIEAASADIRNVEDKSRQIERVVTVIKEVADQTNLLALNAAIEAARAGEEGRGFAVVADEVRKLAQRVAESTEEIAHAVREMRESVNGGVTSIGEVARHVESGVKLADSASAAIGRINQAVGDSVQAVAEISHTIQEQSAAMTSIAQQVEKIAQMTEENSAAAGSTATTAEQLGRITDSMNEVMGAFKVAA